jgi:hypothetical protein
MYANFMKNKECRACSEDKICNPKTGRCVSKSGEIGRELVKKAALQQRADLLRNTLAGRPLVSRSVRELSIDEIVEQIVPAGNVFNNMGRMTHDQQLAVNLTPYIRAMGPSARVLTTKLAFALAPNPGDVAEMKYMINEKTMKHVVPLLVKTKEKKVRGEREEGRVVGNDYYPGDGEWEFSMAPHRLHRIFITHPLPGDLEAPDLRAYGPFTHPVDEYLIFDHGRDLATFRYRWVQHKSTEFVMDPDTRMGKTYVWVDSAGPSAWLARDSRALDAASKIKRELWRRVQKRQQMAMLNEMYRPGGIGATAAVNRLARR